MSPRPHADPRLLSAIEKNPPLVREMLRVLREFTGAEADRERIEAWTRKVCQGEERRPTFPSHGEANSIFASLWCIQETSDAVGGYILRPEDISSFIDSLTRGGCRRMNVSKFVCLTLSFDQLAERVGAAPERWWCDGFGWMKSLVFSSAVSGMQFGCMSDLIPRFDDSTSAGACVNFEEGIDTHRATLELLETLEIDLDQTCGSEPFEARWVLLRQDDNGHRFEVQHFVSTSAARAKLAEFEALSHKQTYWLERVPPEEAADQSRETLDSAVQKSVT